MCFYYQKETGSDSHPEVLGETPESGATVHVNSITQTCPE